MRCTQLTAWRQWKQVDTAADEGRMEMQAEVTREWVTYKQAEEISGLSRTTLWKLLSAGEIKAARVGRAVRINRRSVDDYLERASEGS